ARLDIGTPPRPTRSTTGTAAKDVAEDVGEGREDVTDVAETGAAEAAARSGMTEPIVAGPPLRVGEDLVCLRCLFEPAFGFGIVGIAIRVQLHRHAAIGALEVARVRVARHAENFVVVLLFRHGGHSP